MNSLIEVSKYAGMREDLVQASGGNSSIKLDGSRMAIKASGIQLADVEQNKGYSIVNYSLIVKFMQDLVCGKPVCTETEILEKAVIEGGRPSIETFLHAITGKVTLHTHSTAVSVLAARTGGMEVLKQHFPNSLVVDYATPGVKLAHLYYQAYLRERKKKNHFFDVIFLKNHGIIVSGNTANEVILLTESVNMEVEHLIGLDNSGYRNAYELYKKFDEINVEDRKIVVRVENKKILDYYCANNYNMWDFQVCPDCVVFCGKKAYSYYSDNFAEDYQQFVIRFGFPVLVQYKKDLFIRAESVKKAREIESVLAYSAQVALLNKSEKLELLSDAEQNYLLNWDAEKYRKNIK